MTELQDLQKPAEQLLSKLGIKYFHLQKTRFKAIDTNRKYNGIPDLIIFLYNKIWIVEFKADKNTLTPKQQEWVDYFKNNRYNIDVINSFDVFKDKLMERMLKDKIKKIKSRG